MRIIKTQDYLSFKSKDIALLDGSFKNVLQNFFTDEKVKAERKKEKAKSKAAVNPEKKP